MAEARIEREGVAAPGTTPDGPVGAGMATGRQPPDLAVGNNADENITRQGPAGHGGPPDG